MPVNREAYLHLVSELRPKNVTLVAVSKTKPVEDIKELYDLGQRDFGENYVQELTNKQAQLPGDIRWHFIGHLQTNKVKFIAPFVQLIHAVDSLKLLREINKQAEKNKRVIDCLLQIHIAQEETKFGFSKKELEDLFNTNLNELHELKNVNILGLMGMASLTDDMNKVKKEFSYLKSLFEQGKAKFSILSMGMTSDYKIAIEEGSNMVRIGSLIFGEREKKN
ncbi:MAG TPA: YggS family pyridoxal phosphate-dependent enzyme [Chitinophagaceae bacterium]|nr:YggS family pyridoxal phosphate-dependent enzyme [Chitinophagaceae bacterium]